MSKLKKNIYACHGGKRVDFSELCPKFELDMDHQIGEMRSPRIGVEFVSWVTNEMVHRLARGCSEGKYPNCMKAMGTGLTGEMMQMVKATQLAKNLFNHEEHHEEGLDAMTTEAAVNSKDFEPKVEMWDIDKVIPTSDNPRRIFRHMDDLVKSIEVDGIQEPLLGRPHPTMPGCVDLRAGERRLRAGKLAKLTRVPVIVRPMSDAEAFRITIIENLQRDGLHPLEEADAIQKYLDKGLSLELAASELGKDRTWVARRSRLGKLIPTLQDRFLDVDDAMSRWPVGYMEIIARFPADVQKHIEEEFKRPWDFANVHCLADLKRVISSYQHSLATAPWKLSDERLVPAAGACETCPTRSDRQSELFDEDELLVKKGKACVLCMNQVCWKKKLAAHLVNKAEELRQKHGALVLASDDTDEDTPFAGQTVGTWQAERNQCKKSEAGAVPALVVGGNRAGEVIWTRAIAGKGKNGTAENAESAKNGGEVSLEEKLKRHEVLRARICMGAIEEVLSGWYFEILKNGNDEGDESDGTDGGEITNEELGITNGGDGEDGEDDGEDLLAPEGTGTGTDTDKHGLSRTEMEGEESYAFPDLTIERVVALACVFGTKEKQEQPCYDRSDIWELVNAGGGSVVSESSEELLLRSVCGVLAARLRNGRQEAVPRLDEARNVCAALEMDFDLYWARACEAKPYPKGWGVDKNGEPLKKEKKKTDSRNPTDGGTTETNGAMGKKKKRTTKDTESTKEEKRDGTTKKRKNKTTENTEQTETERADEPQIPPIAPIEGAAMFAQSTGVMPWFLDPQSVRDAKVMGRAAASAKCRRESNPFKQDEEGFQRRSLELWDEGFFEVWQQLDAIEQVAQGDGQKGLKGHKGPKGRKKKDAA